MIFLPESECSEFRKYVPASEEWTIRSISLPNGVENRCCLSVVVIVTVKMGEKCTSIGELPRLLTRRSDGSFPEDGASCFNDVLCRYRCIHRERSLHRH